MLDKTGREITIGDGLLFSLKDTVNVIFGIVIDTTEDYLVVEVNEKWTVSILRRKAKYTVSLPQNNIIAKNMSAKEYSSNESFINWKRHV